MTDVSYSEISTLSRPSSASPAAAELMSGAQRLQLLYKIGQELNSSRDIHEVISRILTLATTHVQADKGSILLFDSQGEVSHRILVRRDRSPEFANQVVKDVLEQGLAGWVIREQQGALVSDIRDDPRWLILPDDQVRAESVVAVPILKGSRLLGLVTLHRLEAGFFSEHHRDLLAAIANQAAIALENARLFAEQERIVQERNEAVVETTAFLRNVIDSALDYAIVAVDMQGLFLIWNEGAHRMFGYSTDEVVGQATADIFYGSQFLNKPSHRNLLQVILETPEDTLHTNRWDFVRRDGHSFPADVTVTYIRNAAGQPVGILGIIRDVTEQVRLELAKSQFVTNVSYELRTPISVLKLQLANLLRHYHRLDDETRLDLLTKSNHQAGYLEQMIQDILDLSQIDADKLTVQAEPFDLSEAVRRVLTGFEESAAAQDIALTHQGLDASVHVVGDSTRTGQVLQHLLRNAFKFTPAGGNVHVSLEGDQDAVRLSVRDTGPGIPASEHYRIFERFYRGTTATADKRGTGLGLAIAKHLVEAQGGYIEVQSEEDKGSAFTIVLPRELSTT
jgi:PAS domain S-box-containing protein